MKDMDDLIKMYDYLTPMMAQKSGISKFKFYKYVQEKGLDQVRRGVYVAGNEWVDELYVIHQRCSRAVGGSYRVKELLDEYIRYFEATRGRGYSVFVHGGRQRAGGWSKKYLP